MSEGGDIAIDMAGGVATLRFSEDDAHLADAEQLYAAADASADYAEGRRAFTEKRTPRFTGN
jgi:hypothetical protein